MPAWISVYCILDIDNVAPDHLQRGIRQADYWTLAECYGIDEHLVDPALGLLSIESTDDGYQLRYRPEGERQLAIYCWSDSARVKEETEEVFETRMGDTSVTASRINEHMKRVDAVIGIELGFSQLEDMGIVFAYEVARWFGEHFGGLIKGEDDSWSIIENGGYVHL